MIALLMAGQHTSSTTTTWMLLFLTNNQKYIDMILEERELLLGAEKAADPATPLAFDHIKSMSFLGYCMKESLRLRPPIITLMRKVIEEQTFEGHAIPPGDYLCSSPAVSQLDETLYPCAQEFRPERFEADAEPPSLLRDAINAADAALPPAKRVSTSRTTDMKYSYSPFGGGRHRCIGEPFAEIQIRTIVTTILSLFRFSFPEGKGFPACDYTSLIVMPEKPTMLAYERR